MHQLPRDMEGACGSWSDCGRTDEGMSLKSGAG
jgi:hypothetical protein